MNRVVVMVRLMETVVLKTRVRGMVMDQDRIMAEARVVEGRVA